MEAFLRGNRFSAAKAAEYGLINRAVPAAELDAAVDEVLADLHLGGPTALGHAKRLVYDVPGMDQKEAFARTAELSAGLFKGEEAAAGMKAFLKREKPPWADGRRLVGPARDSERWRRSDARPRAHRRRAHTEEGTQCSRSARTSKPKWTTCTASSRP